MGIDKKGYTLVELIIVMGIFTVVAMAISVTFNNLLKQQAQQSRSATSQIAGIVGLEMLRSDIAHAGFALPWSYPSGYTLPNVEVSGPPATDLGIDPTTFNEIQPPRAVLGGTTNPGSTPPGPHYLVLKSALLAINSQSVGRWGFINYSANNKSYIHRVGEATSDIRPATDQMITLITSFDTLGNETKLLATGAGGTNPFSYAVANTYEPPAAFQPADSVQSAFAYAISDTALNMPYNRADYYVDFSANKPASCNQGTGVLYKAVAGQGRNYKSGATNLLYPLLNCVGDMRVVFALDTTASSNSANSYATPDSVTLSAADLRAQLRQVMVYILAHEGGKDSNFTYPGSSITVGYAGAGQTWSASDLSTKFGTNWRNYRWKLYSIVVNMPNMQQ